MEFLAQKFWELIKKSICYVSWDSIFWPFHRRSARAPTIKAVRGTVAIKGIFDSPFPLRGGPFLLRGHRFPLWGDLFLTGPFQFFNCWFRIFFVQTGMYALDPSLLNSPKDVVEP